MRILIVGASKGTGSLAVKAALARGHDVTAFARSPDRLGFENPQLTKASGDFHVAENVDRVMPGHDAVIVTASAASIASFRQDPTFFSRGTALVISAMKAYGVPRLVVLSALGVGETRKVRLARGKASLLWAIQIPLHRPRAPGAGCTRERARMGHRTARAAHRRPRYGNVRQDDQH